MLANGGVKQCSGCKGTYAVSLYTKNKSTKDGLSVYCTPCGRSKNRASAKKHVAKRNTQQQVWRKGNPDKAKQHQARYRDKNQEQIRATDRAWLDANPDRRMQVCATYRLNNVDKEREYRKAYHANNPGLRRARLAQYRSALVRATPMWFCENDKKLFKQFCEKAELLRRDAGEVWHVDHVIPLQGKSVCGLHISGNWQLLPARENLSKGNKFNGDTYATTLSK